jgi:hypothetical protein
VRLALFALVVQFAASFGHMHAEDLGLSLTGASGRTQVAAALPHHPAGPSDQDRFPAPDDCPICATMALIATGIASLPPPLVVPFEIHAVSHWVAPARPVRPTIALSFRSRAPPLT